MVRQQSKNVKETMVNVKRHIHWVLGVHTGRAHDPVWESSESLEETATCILKVKK